MVRWRRWDYAGGRAYRSGRHGMEEAKRSLAVRGEELGDWQ
jgi:hypothetical protein